MKTTEIKLTDRNGVKINKGHDLRSYQGCSEYFSAPFIFDIDVSKNEQVLIKDYDNDQGEWVCAEDLEVIVDLKDIAEQSGLDYIETTTGSNGYPQNLKFAVTGFENFEQAQKLADKYGLSIERFEKRDGWQLWTRGNRTMFGPYKNLADDFGDNYSEACEEDITERISEALKENDFDGISDKIMFLKEKLEILEELEKADDDEIVIESYGTYYETIKKESMSFYHDTRHYIIGLI